MQQTMTSNHNDVNGMWSAANGTLGLGKESEGTMSSKRESSMFGELWKATCKVQKEPKP